MCPESAAGELLESGWLFFYKEKRMDSVFS